jgi:outer membrane protein OmpA-like peptidoglycan-associated protein
MKAATCLLAALAPLCAQAPQPTRQQPARTPAQTGQPLPVFRATVVSRTVKAVNYRHRTGTVQVDLRGTELLAAARAEVRVESRLGSAKIAANFSDLSPANRFGPEYLTYVLWAVTPEGRAANLGEVVLDGGHAKLLTTTGLQFFALIVTAEPYFAVTQPGDVVVMENVVRRAAAGSIEPVEAQYELLARGQYVAGRGRYQPVKIDGKKPLQLAEAENAVEIARLAGAGKYAADTFAKAIVNLRNAQDFLHGSRNRKRSETAAREATQIAEDARIVTLRKIGEERLANERASAAAREAQAQAEAQRSAAEARLEQDRRARAETGRRAAGQSRMLAGQAKREAGLAAAEASDEHAAADPARVAAQRQRRLLAAETGRAQLAAPQTEQVRQQSGQEQVELRQRLLTQLNTILETRETARGLIVNMSGVWFDTVRCTLKPGAREKLAKVAGILLAYPGLRVQVEGYTDSTGSEEFNQRLPENCAAAVRDYMAQPGMPVDFASPATRGESNPVAANEAAAGRQRNRLVELVVSGDAIGTGSGGAAAAAPWAPPPAQHPQ